MNKYVIEIYDTFGIKGCLEGLIFSNINNQTITSNYYNFVNDDDDDGNNIPGTPIYNALTEKKLVKDAVETKRN